ncbi:MAG: GAF domain-containing protein [Chloroflexi bacterium]|nr:GAF domain-containing protein [Chloroflexota bacterium]
MLAATALPTEERIRVLFVDDSSADVELIVRALQTGGVAVNFQRVDSAPALLVALQESRWDVILTDFTLPGFSGYEAIELCRRQAPGVPCLLVTGTLTLADAADAVALGVGELIAERELIGAETQRRATRFEALFRLGIETAGELDSTRLIRLACRTAATLLGAEQAALCLWNQSLGCLVRADDTGQFVPTGSTLNSGEGASGRAFLERGPVLVDEYANLPKPLVGFPTHVFRSAAAVPMVVGDEVLGTLAVFASDPRRFTEGDATTLGLIAALVAPAYQASRLHTATRRRESEQAALADIGRVSLTATNPSAVLAAAVPILAAHIGLGVIAIEPGEEGGQCRVVASAGWPEVEIGQTFAIDLMAMPDLTPEVFEVLVDHDLDNRHPLFELLVGAATALSAALLPISVNSKTAAVVLAKTTAGSAFDPADILFLRAARDNLASAMRVKHAESSARLSVERLRFVIANAPLIVAAIDRNGKVLFIAGQGLSRLDIKVDQILGQAAVSKLMGPQAAVALQRAMAGEEVLDLYRPAGTDEEWEIRYQPVPEMEDGFPGVVAVALDVSERGKAQRAHLESATKSRLLSTVSHELRNPLGSIMGFAELLESATVLDQKQARFVGHVRSSGARMLTLVNDLLDLSKIAAGRMDFSVENVVLQPAVAAAVDQVAFLAGSKEIRVTAGEIVGCVRADSFRLSQILLNVLSNAVKYTPSGGHVTITTAEVDGCGLVMISDDGPGIPLAYQEAIFEEFTQADPSSDEAKRGTGLGLSLSRGLARGMGGDISVSSEPGRGAVFTITLPAGQVSPSVAT